MKAKRDKEHCWRCGTKFYDDYIIGVIIGLPIIGKQCVPDFEGGVLCENCADREVDEQMSREFPEECAAWELD